MADLSVSGMPATQGSMRSYAARRKSGEYTGKVGLRADSGALEAWRAAVQTEARRVFTIDGLTVAPLGGPLSIQVDFKMPRPARHFIAGNILRDLREDAPMWPIDGAASRDIDKLLRAIFDGLKAGGAVIDDRNFVTVGARRIYAERGELPGADIRIIPCLATPGRFRVLDHSEH